MTLVNDDNDDETKLFEIFLSGQEFKSLLVMVSRLRLRLRLTMMLVLMLVLSMAML